MAEVKPVNPGKISSSPGFWLAIVAAAALVERLLVLVLYQPVAFSDTPSYRRLADTVLQGFANYDGTRTPGYPVFLALVGNDQRVWVAQLLLGFITTLLLFLIGWKLTDKAWFGGMLGLLHTLNLEQLFFESNLLTESLTTFVLILVMAGMLAWIRYPKIRRLWMAFLLGVFSTAVVLIRPLFIYLPFFLLLYLIFETRPASRDVVTGEDVVLDHQAVRKGHFAAGAAIGFLVPVIVLIGGWVAFIHKNFGDWSLTTMTGYHLVQHTGNFFEFVPDEYATLRDIYIRYRNAHIAEFGTQTNAIWDAIPEMSQASGYSFYALSKVLTRISIQLILHHPFLYLKNAITGWWMFWRVPVYWSADALRYAWLGIALRIAVQIERGLLFLTNLVFIFSSVYFVITELISKIRHRPSPFDILANRPIQRSFLWLTLGTIWIASILQTLLDHGDNPRFLVPLQSVVVLWVAAIILQLYTQKRLSSRNPSQP